MLVNAVRGMSGHHEHGADAGQRFSHSVGIIEGRPDSAGCGQLGRPRRIAYEQPLRPTGSSEPSGDAPTELPGRTGDREGLPGPPRVGGSEVVTVQSYQQWHPAEPSAHAATRCMWSFLQAYELG